MIDSHGQIYSLSNYEEAVGDLTDISMQDGLLLARIGKVKLALPAYMMDSIKPLLGQRIAILRTAIPNKSYLIHIILTLSTTTEDSRIKVPSELQDIKIAGMI
jgi:hypothetical protein